VGVGALGHCQRQDTPKRVGAGDRGVTGRQGRPGDGFPSVNCARDY
jgi:hypothetical protein